MESIDWKNRSNDNFEYRLANAYMDKAFASDMSFFIESESITIPGHSFIIAPASEVLERLILGTGNIPNKERVITVLDCPLKEFKVLQRYLYTGKYCLICLIDFDRFV